MLDHLLKNVTVIGACGKMGRGIALLLLQEMARCEAKETAKVGTGKFRLHLVDTNIDALHDLRSYFRPHLKLYAEKNIISLRESFLKNEVLVSNLEIIESFINGAQDSVYLHPTMDSIKNQSLIFEAVGEDIELKATLLKKIKEEGNEKAYFFSNTSSIPISLLNTQAKLNSHLVGFHFYNPAHQQKLVEIIEPKEMDPLLQQVAAELAKRLNKITVYSQDVAGFIGNGHFFREISFALKQVERLMKEQMYSQEESLYIVNKVTQEFLIRPMGIFQLIDYVGIDTAEKIASIMQEFFPKERLFFKLIFAAKAQGILGGQDLHGHPKDGLFQYDHTRIRGIFSFKKMQYEPIELFLKMDTSLGSLPKSYIPWKRLHADPEKSTKLIAYFNELEGVSGLGADLAKKFLVHSQQVIDQLVSSRIAKCEEDVTKVLINGFFHLYGTPLKSFASQT